MKMLFDELQKVYPPDCFHPIGSSWGMVDGKIMLTLAYDGETQQLSFEGVRSGAEINEKIEAAIIHLKGKRDPQAD